MDAIKDRIETVPVTAARTTGREELLRFLAGWIMVTLTVFAVPAAVHSVGKVGWKWIDAAQVQTMLTEGSGLWIIDVRGALSFDAEHAEGAVNIPAETLKYKKLPASKTLVLFDDSLGQRVAREAADMLAASGHENIYVLAGGLAAWRSEGLSTVGNKSNDRGVSARELKWAMENGVSVRIYDMRDASEREKGTLQGSKQMEGKTYAERFRKLMETIGDSSTGSLQGGLVRPQPVILVFAASENAPVRMQEMLRTTKGDFRYLIGGYEVFTAKEPPKVTETKTCPTCPQRQR